MSKKTDWSVWTFFLGLRNGWQGLKVLPRRTDGQRQGVEPLPRCHDGRTGAWNRFQGIATVSAKGWNLFQGAFPAGEGLKSGSKGRRRPEEVEKTVPRGCTRRRRLRSLSQFFRELTPELSDHRYDLPQLGLIRHAITWFSFLGGG